MTYIRKKIFQIEKFIFSSIFQISFICFALHINSIYIYIYIAWYFFVNWFVCISRVTKHFFKKKWVFRKNCIFSLFDRSIQKYVYKHKKKGFELRQGLHTKNPELRVCSKINANAIWICSFGGTACWACLRKINIKKNKLF